MENGINQINLRVKVRKAVTPKMRLKDIAEATEIDITLLSRFVKRGMELNPDQAQRVYRFLLGRKTEEIKV